MKRQTVSTVRAWFKTHIKLHVVVALTVFAVTLTASLYYWNNIREGVRTDLQATYERQVHAYGVMIGSRLQMHQNLLDGSVGLFAVHDTLTQAEWEAYFARYDILRTYPEVQGIGFSRHLTRDDVPGFLQEMQAQGRTDYAIAPGGDRDVYMPVTYNARFTGNNGKSVGYDGLTDPQRRQGMHAAIETGKPAMSGKVHLVSESRENRSAVIIYAPVYKKGLPTTTAEERRAAIYGVTYIALDIETLLDGIPQMNKNLHIALRVRDTTLDGPQAVAYESDSFYAYLNDAGGVDGQTEIDFFGRKWAAHFAAPASIISTPERELPAQALWRGILLSLLFAGLVWYLIANRERSYFRQKQREVQTAKDDLLSLASHQLRTPATVVKQYVGMLLQGYVGKLTRQQKVMLTNAYESNERQLEIINQLLYVARLDAGRIKLRPAKTDLTRLIREVAKDQATVARERHQILTYNLPKRPVSAEIDPQYMRMVFENLLSNAIKYTPEHGSIGLSIRKVQGQALVAVTDTGVGVEQSDIETIFEKFTRVENDLSTDVNGSGVGLYLTQQIVSLHGGTIEVQSRPGEGSTFIVHIPLEAAEEQSDSS